MHLFFYRLSLLSYQLAIRIAAMWNPKARRWISGRKNIFRLLERAFSGEADAKRLPVIWMHCASLGEFEQGRPVLEKLKQRNPASKVLLTFFSPSGYEISKDYHGANYIFYLPLDTPRNAVRFLNIVNPRLVLWVKYEFWYFYLTQLRKRKIPTLLISGIFRDDLPFFKWYGFLHRKILSCFTHFFVQTNTSKKLLASIGYSGNVTVTGDTRFDRVVEISEQFKPDHLIDSFCSNRKVIVAGSTWAEDEEELDHFANTDHALRFIIAPHEIDKEHLKEVKALFRHSIFYSELKKDPAAGSAANTIIIDNIGMLSRLYHYATIAYIGGGFGNDGVHNVLEAAVYGKPVIFGPVYDKYVEAMDLVEEGGAMTFETALELEKILQQLLTDEQSYLESSKAARNYVFSKRGATEKIIEYIQENRLLTS